MKLQFLGIFLNGKKLRRQNSLQLQKVAPMQHAVDWRYRKKSPGQKRLRFSACSTPRSGACCPLCEYIIKVDYVKDWLVDVAVVKLNRDELFSSLP